MGQAARPAAGPLEPRLPARSEQGRQITATNASHSRRVRLANATAERSTRSMSPTTTAGSASSGGTDLPVPRPDPLTSSLDHTVQLAASDGHSRANTHPSRWICNIRKGARR